MILLLLVVIPIIAIVLMVLLNSNESSSIASSFTPPQPSGREQEKPLLIEGREQKPPLYKGGWGVKISAEVPVGTAHQYRFQTDNRGLGGFERNF